MKRDSFGAYRTPQQVNRDLAKLVIGLALLACMLISVARRIENSPSRERARADAALQWQRTHPEEYRAMRAASRAHANDTDLIP